MGNCAQSFYYHSFIYTVLRKLIEWSCFFSSIHCIAISFGVRLGISQLLLLHC